MKSNLSRRDFLKLSGLALGGLAFSPFLPGLTEFDDSLVIRIATAQMPVRKEPTDKSPIQLTHYRDELVHVYDEYRAEEPAYNPIWYLVWGGYMHRDRVQRVKTIYQQPVDIPQGERRLAEITVPFTTPYRYSKTRGWESLSPPLYYSSAHWVEGLDQGPDMVDYTGAWYRIYDELDSNVPYFVPAIHMRLIPLDMFDPISPEVPFEEKLIEVNLATQSLTAYEYGKSVFQTNISSGIPGAGQGGDRGLSTTTPSGKFNILEKMPSKHMGYSYFSTGQSGNVEVSTDPDNYVLPGVPWDSFFTPVGHAFHGTYWHENFGTPMSHGCVNMRTEEANWLFRWALPPHTPEALSNHQSIGTKVETHY